MIVFFGIYVFSGLQCFADECFVGSNRGQDDNKFDLGIVQDDIVGAAGQAVLFRFLLGPLNMGGTDIADLDTVGEYTGQIAQIGITDRTGADHTGNEWFYSSHGYVLLLLKFYHVMHVNVCGFVLQVWYNGSAIKRQARDKLDDPAATPPIERERC